MSDPTEAGSGSSCCCSGSADTQTAETTEAGANELGAVQATNS